MPIFGKIPVVVALGGGGARGLAHLGVLEVLEEAKVPIDAVVGISAGALVGAIYSLEPDARALTRRTLAFMNSEEFRNDVFMRVMFGGGGESEQNAFQSIISGLRRGIRFTSLIRKASILDASRLREVIREFVGEHTFDDLKIPFAVPTLDLGPPREVVLSEGSLLEAVTASCSIPGFFPPVERDGMLLADCGVIGSVPVVQARAMIKGALVIAVDLSRELEVIDSVERGWDSILRCQAIAGRKLNELALTKADVVINPAVGERRWGDFSDLETIVECGREGARQSVEGIHKRLSGVLARLRRRNL